jgi:hypothetical protein
MSVALAPSLCAVPAAAQIAGSKDQQRQAVRKPAPDAAAVEPGSALRFTNDGHYAVVPNTAAIDMISGPLTLEAWVRPEAGILARGYSSILSKQMGGTGYMLATNLSPAGRAFKSEVAGRQVTSRAQPAIDGWQHVAAVWESGRLRIYVNGQLDGELATGPPIPNGFPIWIGSSPFGGDTNWRGAVDEVRVWAAARTQGQIQSTMNRSLCGDEPGLRGYWPLDERHGGQILDASGRSDGTVSGAQWVSGVALGGSTNCKDKLTIEAFIDGRSRLVVRRQTAYWQHLDFAAPGRWGFRNLPTVINGEEWFPRWPDVPDAENRFCACVSSAFTRVKPALDDKSTTVALRVRQGRGVVTIVEQPSKENDYAVVLEFDDNPLEGAATYRIELIHRRDDWQGGESQP